MEIAKSGKASQQLSMMYKALGNATDTVLKSKDVQIALSDIGKEAGLSADKIKILQEESREVGKQLKYIDSKEFKEIANEAEKGNNEI